jgi:alkanesulfonate monooxygenase SsuD/methylene tetrahydromethanopterin reductase-like flavin-dependent oxidoreductase (luciferase family)
VARLDETVAILRRLGSGDVVDFAGRFCTLERARLAPPPLQQPAPPVWIAARGPRALAVAARRGDGWEGSYLAPDAVAWRRLRALLAEAGRPPEALRRSIELDVVVGRSAADAEAQLTRFCARRAIERRHPLLEAPLVGDAAAVRDRIARYAAAGATDLMLGFADFPYTAMLETFAERVLPYVAEAR